MLAGLGAGAPLEGSDRSRMERAFGHDFRRIRLHADPGAAAAARRLGANAFTMGSHIGFASGRYNPGTRAGDGLLAHELAHTIQQHDGAARPRVADTLLEKDADGAAARAVQALHGGFRGGDGTAAPALRTSAKQIQLDRDSSATADRDRPMTHDQMLVQRARRMLPIVRRHIADLTARRTTRDILLMKREQIEDPAARMEGRPAMEAQRLARMNRRPLRVEIADDAIIFRVRFQVQFESPAHANRLGAVRGAVQRAAETVWTSPQGEAILGKRFEMKTEVVPADGARNHDFWLIVVRADDQGSVQRAGCALDDPRPVVAAVTDPDCDGGVMNIPPRSTGDASLIGHELLHLFGLVDRYLLTQTQPAPQRATPRLPGAPAPAPAPAVVGTIRMREPGDHRRDPLGAEQGPILREDLAFIFDRLGVYDADEADFARRIGMDLGQAQRWERYFLEVIRLGRDPHRLFRVRDNFNDRMLRNAENL
jgi:hypothetical protein